MTIRVKIPLLWMVLLILFAVAQKVRSHAATIRDSAVPTDEIFYLPPASWLRAMSLGFNEAAADLVWVKTIIYFGGSFSKQKTNNSKCFTPNYLYVAAFLDPHFRRLYTDGSAIMLFQRSGEVTEQTVKMSMELLEKGTEVFPDDGEILFNLGFMHYYELKPFLPADPDDPKTKEHSILGAELIGRAALMKNAPPFAAALSHSLLSREGLEDVLIEHLKAMLAKETDPQMRATLAQKLEHEIGKAATRDIVSTNRLVRQWRAEMPYIPFDFYLLIHRTEISIKCSYSVEDTTLDFY